MTSAGKIFFHTARHRIVKLVQRQFFRKQTVQTLPFRQRYVTDRADNDDAEGHHYLSRHPVPLGNMDMECISARLTEPDKWSSSLGSIRL